MPTGFLKSLFRLLLCMLVVYTQAAAQAGASFDSTLQAIKGIENNPRKLTALLNYEKQIHVAHPGEAVVLDNMIVDVSSGLKDDSDMVKGLLTRADAYVKLHNLPKALADYTIAADIAERHNDYTAEIDANEGISGIYNASAVLNNNPADLEQASKYSIKALDISKGHNLVQKQPAILGTLAAEYNLQKLYDKAIKTYEEAIAICKQINNPAEEAGLLADLGTCLKNIKDYKRSLAVYKEANHITDSLQLKYQQAFVLDNMAGLYYDMGQLKLSEASALNAVKIARGLAIDPVSEDMYALLEKLYVKEQRYQDALNVTKKLSLLKDSIATVEKALEVREIQEEYTVEIKDKQITAQSSEIAFAKKRSLYMGLALVMLVVVAVVIYTSRTRMARLNKQITVQQAALIEQKQELQQVNNVKDRLFSVISHDLRTPVNSLISFTMLLENSNLPPEKLHRYAGELKNNLSYTAEMMENLLSFAKSQMQGYKPVLQPFDIAGVVTDTITLLNHGINNKRLVIANTVSHNTQVYADINMMALILRNLLSNAVKYSYPGGTISIFTIAAKSSINVCVKDEGKGIDETQVNEFNSSYYNHQPVDSTPGTQNEKGTGMGLLLCKNFAALMYGKIWAESTPGKGACFTIQLPSTLV